MYRYVMALMVAFFCAAGSFADDWSQFRGPNGTGISNTTHLPVEFGPERNVIWKTALPAGHSSPVLGRDRIFMTGFEGNKLFTICVDRKTGKLLWRREVPHNRNDRLLKPNNPASPSPVTDGENAYVFFQDFGLISYGPDGKERWRVPLGPFNTFYGLGASPILVDDKVVMPCDQDTNSFLIAVDKTSGRVRWKVSRPWVVSGYSTPILYKPKGGPVQIVIPESFQLTAYSVENGEKIWWVRGLACEMKSIPVLDGDTLYINGWGFPENQPGKQIAVPPFEEVLPKADVDKDGRISLAEGPDERTKNKDYFVVFDLDKDGYLTAKEWDMYRSMMSAENGLLSIKLGGRGDMTASSIRWRYQRPVPQVPSTLLYKGALYMVNDGGVLITFDPATGNVIKQGRLQGAIDKYFASPVAADDKVYLVSQGGAVSVLKAGGEWEILKVNNLDDECFATPAIADGKIYIRTRSALYCFAQRD
ncbi:MAG TPA: PQQ-binding-like beta-propeller repeat protein [Blastocatellia bacterium]|nr:PQQ-binding-like beta-propeller repeat protein [Blastocatellia bacterium]